MRMARIDPQGFFETYNGAGKVALILEYVAQINVGSNQKLVRVLAGRLKNLPIQALPPRGNGRFGDIGRRLKHFGNGVHGWIPSTLLGGSCDLGSANRG